MTSITINEKVKKGLKDFLRKNRDAELVAAYLFFIETTLHLQPVLFSKERTIYRSSEQLIQRLEAEGKLWHQTEIKISFGQHSVNELTKKIYICPFSGKVFGDNTHPHPQDAIYDWVAKCPENTERVGGLPTKRFFVSEDPDVIKSYMPKHRPKEPIVKKVFSSAMSGKLFNSRHAVIEDFKRHYLKPLTLFEVQSQNRFSIDQELLHFLQDQLQEEKIAAFIEALSDDENEEFHPYIEQWVEME